MIVVTGATGTVGGQVVELLLEAGEKVRAMTRDPSKARFDAKVEVVKGDADDAASLERVFDGASAVFAVTLGPSGPDQDARMAKAAKASGARVVKLSALRADLGDPDDLIGSWHGRGEQAVREAGVGFTFVRPGAFMSNALRWAHTIKAQGKFYQPFGDGKTPPIHPRDIATVAALALRSSTHEGKAYSLTGPEALSLHEQARLLAEAAGRPIEYVPVSDEQAREHMTRGNLPAPLIDALLHYAAAIRAGKAATVLPTFEEVTGQKGRTFASWAKENAAVFR